MSKTAQIEAACDSLGLSLKAARVILLEGQEPYQRRLAWLAPELERLAAEAYRLADEASPLDLSDYCLCRKVPCTCETNPKE